MSLSEDSDDNNNSVSNTEFLKANVDFSSQIKEIESVYPKAKEYSEKELNRQNVKLQNYMKEFAERNCLVLDPFEQGDSASDSERRIKSKTQKSTNFNKICFATNKPYKKSNIINKNEINEEEVANGSNLLDETNIGLKDNLSNRMRKKHINNIKNVNFKTDPNENYSEFKIGENNPPINIYNNKNVNIGTLVINNPINNPSASPHNSPFTKQNKKALPLSKNKSLTTKSILAFKEYSSKTGKNGSKDVLEEYKRKVLEKISDKKILNPIKSKTNKSSSALDNKKLNRLLENKDNDYNYDGRISKEDSINQERIANPSHENKRMLRKMNGVLSDSLSEDEEIFATDDNAGAFLIFPDSEFKLTWDLILVLLALYSLIYTPIEIAFGVDASLTSFIINILVDLIFILDCAINFFVPYKNFEENLIKSYKSIAKNYLNGWFLWDFLASLPTGTIIGLINFESNSLKYLNLNSAVRLTKFYRLIKISQFFKIVKIAENDNISKFTNFNILEKLNVSASLRRFLKFVIGFMIITHVLSCIWIYLGTLQEPNWISPRDMSNSDLYVSSVYFIWSTIYTIGYGDITPKNTIERTFVILLMFIGILMYSFAVGSLGNILTDVDKMTLKYINSLQLLNEIKRKHKVPDAFYDKIAKFIKYDYRFNKIEQFVFINELPSALKHTMLTSMYFDILKHFKFFKFGCEEFKSKVLLALRPVRAFKKEYIVVENESLEEFFLLRKGVLSVNLGTKYKEAKIMEIRRCEHFGDILIMAQQKSPVNVRVISQVCDLFYINKKDLIEISLQFPEVWNKIFLVSTYNYLIMLEKIEEKIAKIEDEEKKLDKFLNREINNFDVSRPGQIYPSLSSNSTLENNLNNQNALVINNLKKKNKEEIQKEIHDYIKDVDPSNDIIRKSFNAGVKVVNTVKQNQNNTFFTICESPKKASFIKEFKKDNLTHLPNFTNQEIPSYTINEGVFLPFDQQVQTRIPFKKFRRANGRYQRLFSKLEREKKINKKRSLSLKVEKIDTFNLLISKGENEKEERKTPQNEQKHHLSSILVSNIGKKMRNYVKEQKEPEKFFQKELKHILTNYYEREYYEQLIRLGEALQMKLNKYNLDHSFNTFFLNLLEKDYTN